MNGAESLIRTAVASGVELCLANPGTTEMQLVAALDTVPGIRAVLGLFEGVCTGAADGYARMAGKPALTLLHLGPGFANGIANLHNARRAHSPVVNLIGDHASWHLHADAPLTSDIDSLARPVSGWLRRSASAAELAADGAAAIAAALAPPGQVATLVVPQDCAWDPARGPAPPAKPSARAAVS
jgi:acetolactate synthase-1/2/3 large subunit